MKRQKRLEALESRAVDGPLDVIIDPTISREEAQVRSGSYVEHGPRRIRIVIGGDDAGL